MPTYQYACTDCADRVEAVQKFTDDSLTVCASCGGRLRKVYSPVGIVFKGSGFYRTDSRAAQKSSEARQGFVERRPTPRSRTAPRARTRPGTSQARATRSPGRRSVAARRLVFVFVFFVFVLVLIGLEGRLTRRGRSGQHRRHRRHWAVQVPRLRRRDIGRDAVRPAERPAGRSARWPAGGWRSCRGTAVITGSRRTASRTARTCGRCARSASGRCSRPAPSAR